MGRDIKPYVYPQAERYLILIPKGFTIKKNLPRDNPNYIFEAMPRYGNMDIKDAWNWFSKNYPAVSKHLLPFKEKAEARTDQGDFWWELRACDYYTDFERPKIMYQVFQVKPCFIYDVEGMYCNNSMWIIPKNDKFLYGVLNSKMGWWLISKYCTAIQNGYQLIWKYFGQIPIANGNEEIMQSIQLLVDYIIKEKKKNPHANTSALEYDIDQLVYQIYGLTMEDIKIIEKE